MRPRRTHAGEKPRLWTPTRPVVAGLGKGRRAGFKAPLKKGEGDAAGAAEACPEGLLREVKGRKVEPFYPPAAGRTAQQVLDDAVKKRGLADDPARDGPAKRPRLDLEGNGEPGSGSDADDGKPVKDDDLPPAMLKLREELRKQVSAKKLDGEGAAGAGDHSGEESSEDASSDDSSSSSSSDSSVDENGETRAKLARLPVSEMGKLYFEAKVLRHHGSRHLQKGIFVVAAKAAKAQMYDRGGKVFGSRPDPGYELKCNPDTLKMGAEVRLGGKAVRLGPAVTEGEFLSGAFFLRKNRKRKLIERQRRRAEEKELRQALGSGKNHLAHTQGSISSFGFSMVSKSSGIGSSFRPAKFRVYKSKPNFSLGKKAEVEKQPVALFDADRENAVVLFRAEYKFDSARRPLTSVVVDPIIGDKLRVHQVVGVQFLWDCVTGKRVEGCHGCILADEMGLGKSIQAIALLWTALNQGNYGVPLTKKAIIVAPSSLVQNWCNELVKWLGEGKVNPCSIAQSTARGEKILNTFQHDPQRNVLVISYDQLRKYENRFKDMASVGLVICDEGHRLKNAEIKTTKAVDLLPTTRRVILSGTPLQNDLGEFHAMVNFCNPGVIGNIVTFRTVFETTIMAGREPTCPEPEKIVGGARAHYLATLTNRFILQRKQAVNEKYLPSKVEQTVFIRPSPLQTKLYAAIVASKGELSDPDPDGGPAKRTSPALVTITLLKKLCNHPDLIFEILTAAKAGGAKAAKSLKAVFPKGYAIHQGKPDMSGKMDFVTGLLTQLKAMPSRTRDKVVIVSNYTQTLHVIAALCKAMGVGYFQLDGQTPIKKRQQLVDSFNVAGSPEICFLLSSKAGGVGLNLIGANRLILFDPDWNPANDAQAMGRVWRDGQRKKVFIYRLLTTGTIEEKVYQRQVSKQGLSANVMDATDSSKQHFTNSDLKSLFTLKGDTLCETHELLGCRCLEKAVAGKKSDSLRTFKAHTPKTGPRMDELNGWKHFTSSSQGTDEVLKQFAQGLVTFIFANERESCTEKSDIQTTENFAADAAAIVCDNNDESSSEVSIDEESEGESESSSESGSESED
ncbi:DNA repair protein rhp54 [Diplonema papillatum]|nr:DNA repair protein rhp54 [Diplonema papillatum]KAJ9464472.1 DNA repair protein rhp54 [Diplonema papillatum]